MKLIEISMVLIIILVIFGVILTSVENSTEKIIKSQETNNMEKMVSEVVDNLINNPGVPDDWNKYGKGTPGLAIVNDDDQVISNSISYAKLIALGNDYDNLVNKRLFDSKIKTSMELAPQKSSISSVKIGDTPNGEDIYSLTRLVKCDFYKSYVLNDFQIKGKCNKQHPQDEYSCCYFKVFPGNLKKSDYYLLVDTGEKYDISYVVSSTRVIKDRPWRTAISDTVYLNDEIDFYDDNSAVVFIHLDKPNAKVLLVSVPKNFNKEFLEYDYFRTNECQFTISAWH
ncbi:hypothetical protein [uncultured Methanobrevibacter sp.]|uniref:hypothetical protein n=1 Tax=uncultured Methanobrevibacter sp. TaxID=253161 RepID=UPI0025F284BD|nr:hypothetical protein [uncultured Methanobrevibacter sp.]